jgi:hypothetical protein
MEVGVHAESEGGGGIAVGVQGCSGGGGVEGGAQAESGGGGGTSVGVQGCSSGGGGGGAPGGAGTAAA